LQAMKHHTYTHTQSESESEKAAQLQLPQPRPEGAGGDLEQGGNHNAQHGSEREGQCRSRRRRAAHCGFGKVREAGVDIEALRWLHCGLLLLKWEELGCLEAKMRRGLAGSASAWEWWTKRSRGEDVVLRVRYRVGHDGSDRRRGQSKAKHRSGWLAWVGGSGLIVCRIVMLLHHIPTARTATKMQAVRRMAFMIEHTSKAGTHTQREGGREG
jgi:hypothetical protein